MRLKTKHWLIISGFFLILFLGLVLIIKNAIYWIQPIDDQGVAAVFQFGGTGLKPIWNGLSHLGDFSFCLMLSIAIGLVFAFFKRGFTGGMLIAGVVTVQLWGNYIKTRVSRPRPSLVQAMSDAHSSYPSGHMMVIVMFYGFLMMLLLYVLIKNNKVIRGISIGSCFLVFLLVEGLSRLALGVHVPSDLLGGTFFGFGWLCFWMGLLNEGRKRGFR